MISPESRPLWVGTSWKMNKTLAEADSFIDELLAFPHGTLRLATIEPG